jgi:integrase
MRLSWEGLKLENIGGLTVGVYQRKSGNWCYEIRGRNAEGKWITLDAKYDFASEDEATIAWIEAKRKAKTRMTLFLFRHAVAGRLAHLDLYTVKDEHEKVSKSYANNRVRLSRFAEWADLPVEEISRDMIKEALKKFLDSGMTPANANKHLVAVKAVFNFAIKEGKLAINPTVGIPFFPTEEHLKFIPEPDQVAKILLKAKPMDRAYLTVVAYTAARINEINKLSWEDVRWDADGKGHAAICLWTRKKKGSVRTPRWVPIIDRVKQALQYTYQNRTKNSPWVFTNPKMVVKYPNNPNRWRYIYRDKFFATLCDSAGVPRMGYHNLRHRAASNMMAKGAALTDIQHILGHERATTTDIYLRSLGFNALRGAAELMEDCDSNCDSTVAISEKPLK